MTAPVLVTGGTGTLGRLVVPLLRDAGLPVRVLSRQARPPRPGVTYVVGDLAGGDGVDAAVAGVDTVVHCAGSARGDGDKTRALVAAAVPAGVRHVVNISVVGADRVPMTGRVDRAMFGYFGAKREAETVVAGSGLPWTTLRAAQFHDMLLIAARAMAKLPVVPVPTGLRFQPVDAAEVAARLVELALGPPAGLVPDLAGPTVYGMDEVVRGYLRATGRRRFLLPVRPPGAAARALRAGANLAPGGAVGRRTWEEFLAARVPARG
ncbi:SDR family oxidoreductase [Micromonospora endolithica]|uniref:NAD-dependent epimerase/dehydratase family protein n=1 Tax=Micromonospora endolithica TaxID=230091 RepID=A0A3A9YTF8_9ACTN|nr:NAD(P)H-binding protein [Micromonospora endolithica]RKN39333.1 NAD-dependent epimerase/dehydratase family protein [Micromonospora endolithica]TWJ22745.1 uncharacterized protein YbjT (DUF2867 family) [Micromonospora endolithica]